MGHIGLVAWVSSFSLIDPVQSVVLGRFLPGLVEWIRLVDWTDCAGEYAWSGRWAGPVLSVGWRIGHGRFRLVRYSPRLIHLLASLIHLLASVK
jgi:hypothetical protein